MSSADKRPPSSMLPAPSGELPPLGLPGGRRKISLLAVAFLFLAAASWPGYHRTWRQPTAAQHLHIDVDLPIFSTDSESSTWSRSSNEVMHSEGALLASVAQLQSPPSSKQGSSARIFYNARIWTPGQKAGLFADSMLVDASGSILAVGGRDQVLATARSHSSTSSSRQQMHDMQGHFMMPGFVDAHIHLLAGGLSLSAVYLGTVTSRSAFQAAVAAAADTLAPGEWLLGGLWMESSWGGGMPDRSWLDAAVGDRPAFVTRSDGHMGLASTAALRLANVTAATSDPWDGIVDRDAHGQPTGLLREGAMDLVRHSIPLHSTATLNTALQRATAYALSRGITSVGDLGRAPFTGDHMTSWRDLEEVLQPAAAAGQLGIRVAAYVPLSTWPRMAAKVAAEGRAHASQRLTWGSVKEFADGSLGSRTALMWTPYTDAEDGFVGTRMIELQKLQADVQGAHNAGLQIAVHAIGDRAVDEVVSVFGNVLNGSRLATASWAQPWVHRHRIEHAQHVSGASALSKMAALGISAVANPLHLLDDAAIMPNLLGEERAGSGRSYAFKTMLEAQAPVAFASDWPVADLDALGGTFAAVHRRRDAAALAKTASAKAAASTMVGTNDTACDGVVRGVGDFVTGCSTVGSAVTAHVPVSIATEQSVNSMNKNVGGFWAEERVSMEQALTGHTSGGAYAIGLDNLVGQLQPGFKADFVVLSSSPFDEAEVVEGGMPAVVSTWVDGVCAFGRCVQ